MSEVDFQTIKQKNVDSPIIWHGYILQKHEDWFLFGTRINGSNIIFEGRTDYWDIVK